ncbi:hypothetical protein ACFFP0_02310 [Rhizobium puerariae]|uniref:Uncharacterized protein n=1 Tax=Rhizobium puerariae TaxID=1585791 RepID=A0ABV6AAK4_9HYPH
MNAEHDKIGSNQPRKNGEAAGRIEDELREQLDTTNPEAIREASRLGTEDAYLVAADLEDSDQREDDDQPDGRASPMANADNPER